MTEYTHEEIFDARLEADIETEEQQEDELIERQAEIEAFTS